MSLRITVVILLIISITGCNKDKDKVENEISPTILSLTNSSVEIDLDADGTNDLKFNVIYNNSGSTGLHEQLTVEGLNGGGIAYQTKMDTSYVGYEPVLDTIWSYTPHQEVLAFTENAIIDANLTFNSSSAVDVSYYHVNQSQPPIYEPEDRTDLVGQMFYVAVKMNNKYAWLKIRVVDKTTIYIYDSGYGSSSVLAGIK